MSYKMRWKIGVLALASALNANAQSSSDPVVTATLVVTQDWINQNTGPDLYERMESYINTTLANSGIDGTMQWQGGYITSETGSGFLNPGDFANYLDQNNAEYQDHVSNTSADVIVILYDGDGSGCSASASNGAYPRVTLNAPEGCGNKLNPAWNTSNDHIVYLLAHEIGHILGAKHGATAATPGSGSPSYARGWCLANGDMTVMTNGCTYSTVSPYYSNPNVYFQGSPTGTSTADNARAISNDIAAVAATESHSNPTATAFVTPDSVVPSSTTVTLHWSSTNAIDCTRNGVSIGTHGSSTYTPAADATFTVICSNGTGQGSTTNTFVDIY